MMAHDLTSGLERPRGFDPSTDLTKELESRIVGQPSAIRSIVPYAEMFQADLAPSGRPVGVFLLMGPTGTGKTRTVEALAEALHGSQKNLVRIDCGEFQMEHEVARLIGAPPGYLGHRETQPMITQKRLSSSTSEHSGLSVVLFDEIEKAAPSLSRLLLGVLDKAALHLGDNTVVNFESCLIFLTSNVGAQEMFREFKPGFGYSSRTPQDTGALARKLERIGLNALRRRFAPEFLNRIDSVITYEPLGQRSLEVILDQQLAEFQQLIRSRLGEQAFSLEVTEEGVQFLLESGTSPEYGARELKRTVHRNVVQPIAAKVVRGELPPRCRVKLTWDREDGPLELLPLPEVKGMGLAGPKSKPVTARSRQGL